MTERIFCCVFVLLIAAAAMGQPAVSRGQQVLQISYDDCLRRAQSAFSAEGWSQIGTSGNAVNAFKDNHAAYIVCNPDPDRKMAVNIFVASSTNDGGVPGYERQKLQARMDGSTSQTNPSCENWGWAYAPPGETPAPHGYVTICSNNTAKYSDTGDTSTWRRSGNQMVFTWGRGTVDTLNLSPDGSVMTGANQNGWVIRATRQR